MAPVKPPKLQHLMKSKTTDTCNNLQQCSSSEPVYEEIDIPEFKKEFQTEVAVKPKPMPRSKSQPEVREVYCANQNNYETIVESPREAYPPRYTRLQPVRPPPAPPCHKPGMLKRLPTFDEGFETGTTDRPEVRPRPPLFAPPPPPSLESLSLSSTETEESLYLQILPDQSDNSNTQDINTLLNWLKSVTPSDNVVPSPYGVSIEDETREFHQRAMLVKKALSLFNLLMMKLNDVLRGHISEFSAVADSLDKLEKKNKTMGIAGGTTGAVGGVAAMVGIALAPVTMGASLVATAVGAGMVVSAGGMGAHNAIANKKAVGRTKVEKIIQDYKMSIGDVDRCLLFIHSGMDELRRHDLARLQRAGANPESLRVAELSQNVFSKSPLVATVWMSSERLLDAFAKELDLYFTERKSQKMKKSSESKFASRVRLLSENLQEALDELNNVWDMFIRL